HDQHEPVNTHSTARNTSCMITHHRHHLHLHPFPTRRSSDLCRQGEQGQGERLRYRGDDGGAVERSAKMPRLAAARQHLRHTLPRSEEHTSELQSHLNLVCRLLLEKKKKKHRQASIMISKR